MASKVLVWLHCKALGMSPVNYHIISGLSWCCLYAFAGRPPPPPCCSLFVKLCKACKRLKAYPTEYLFLWIPAYQPKIREIIVLLLLTCAILFFLDRRSLLFFFYLHIPFSEILVSAWHLVVLDVILCAPLICVWSVAEVFHVFC